MRSPVVSGVRASSCPPQRLKVQSLLLEAERVHELEDRILRVENVTEVVLCSLPPLEKLINFAGDPPQTEAPDDGEFERFRPFYHRLQRFPAQGGTLKEHFPQILTYILLRLSPCCDDLVRFLFELALIFAIVLALVDSAGGGTEEALEALEVW